MTPPPSSCAPLPPPLELDSGLRRPGGGAAIDLQGTLARRGEGDQQSKFHAFPPHPTPPLLAPHVPAVLRNFGASVTLGDERQSITNRIRYTSGPAEEVEARKHHPSSWQRSRGDTITSQRRLRPRNTAPLYPYLASRPSGRRGSSRVAMTARFVGECVSSSNHLIGWKCSER